MTYALFNMGCVFPKLQSKISIYNVKKSIFFISIYLSIFLSMFVSVCLAWVSREKQRGVERE